MGQIYLPTINWALMVSCIALVLGFRSSTNLAAAYGVAVTMTMFITTILFYVVARERWGWRKRKALSVCAPFLVIDIAFLGANLIKIPDGGWLPLVVGAVGVRSDDHLAHRPGAGGQAPPPGRAAPGHLHQEPRQAEGHPGAGHRGVHVQPARLHAAGPAGQPVPQPDPAHQRGDPVGAHHGRAPGAPRRPRGADRPRPGVLLGPPALRLHGGARRARRPRPRAQLQGQLRPAAHQLLPGQGVHPPQRPATAWPSGGSASSPSCTATPPAPPPSSASRPSAPSSWAARSTSSRGRGRAGPAARPRRARPRRAHRC